LFDFLGLILMMILCVVDENDLILILCVVDENDLILMKIILFYFLILFLGYMKID